MCELLPIFLIRVVLFIEETTTHAHRQPKTKPLENKDTYEFYLFLSDALVLKLAI